MSCGGSRAREVSNIYHLWCSLQTEKAGDPCLFNNAELNLVTFVRACRFLCEHCACVGLFIDQQEAYRFLLMYAV